ncbi:hypothetical protein HanIR_Chr14g0696531 [Helianthus annuus]|nr:hypothetical protein HanIR_Chr14g0696531 [Helianthus annuus]
MTSVLHFRNYVCTRNYRAFTWSSYVYPLTYNLTRKKNRESINDSSFGML